MVDTSTQSTLSKLISTAIALAAALAAQKLVSGAWKALSGHQPPKADDTGDAGLAEVAAAAVIIGAVVALVRVLAIRAAVRALR